MAGNTGKMTREQIRLRGPRLVLGRFLNNGALFIYTEGQTPVERYAVLAKSYSRSYLERIAKANR
jgi:hypothetical protein